MKQYNNMTKVQLSTLYGKMNGRHINQDVTHHKYTVKNIYTDTYSIVLEPSGLYPTQMKEGEE